MLVNHIYKIGVNHNKCSPRTWFVEYIGHVWVNVGLQIKIKLFKIENNNRYGLVDKSLLGVNNLPAYISWNFASK